MKMARHIVTFRIVLQMLDAHDLAETRPAFIVHANQADIAILGTKGADHAMKEGMAAAGALRFLAGQAGILKYLTR